MRNRARQLQWLTAWVCLAAGSRADAAPPRPPTERPGRPAPVTRPGAATPGAPSAAPPPARAHRRGLATLVFLADHSQPQKAMELSQAVSSQLSDTRVRLQIAWLDRYPSVLSQQLDVAKRLAKQHRAVAAFWCDLTKGGPVHLAILDKAEVRLIIRSLEGTAPGERVEAAALIVRASITAYLRGAALVTIRPPPSRPPRPPPLHPVVVQTAPPRRSHVALELGYVLDMWSHSNDQLAISGLAARLAWWIRPEWAVFTGYRYSQRITLPVETVPDASLGLQRHPVLLGARYRRRFGRLGLGCALSVVMEYTRLDLSGVNAELVALGPDRGDLLWAVDAAFELWVRVVARLRLWLALGVEGGINNKKYYLLGETRPLGWPWPVRPRFQLGLAVDVF